VREEPRFPSQKKILTPLTQRVIGVQGVTHEPLGPEAENVSTPNTSGNKTPGLAQKARRASGGSGVIPRLTVHDVALLATHILYVFEVYEQLADKVYSPVEMRSIADKLPVDTLVNAVLEAWGVEKPRYVWAEEEWYSLSIPILYKGKKAFIVVSEQEGFKIIEQGNERFAYIEQSFGIYGVSSKPVIEVV